MDVEAEPTLGGVVCDSCVDGDWWSVVRESTKGIERSYAAGELYGDVYCHSERGDDKYAADSVHGAINSILRPREFLISNGRDIEEVRVERLAANEEADGAQLLPGSRVMNVVQFVVEIVLN